MAYYKSIIRVFLCAVVMVSFSGLANAGIIEVQKLSFGRWAIAGNSSSNAITVAPNGNVTKSSPTLVMIVSPQPGIYQVNSLPPFHVVGSVDVTVNQQMRAGGSQNFIVDNFTTTIPPADGSGTTTLTLGARARTSGNSQGYPDDTYEGELHIEINL